MHSVVRRCISLFVLISLLFVDITFPMGTAFAYEHSLDELSSSNVGEESVEYHSLDELPSYTYETFAAGTSTEDAILNELPSVQEEKINTILPLKSKTKGKKIRLDRSESLLMQTGSLAQKNLTIQFPVNTEITTRGAFMVDPSRIIVGDLSSVHLKEAKKSMKSYQINRTKGKSRITPKKQAFIDMLVDFISPQEAYAGEAVKFEPDTTTSFEFGIPDQHLIFSEPVKISLDADYRDGTYIDILVKHAGDTDYGNMGLSTNPNTTCNPDGSTTLSGNMATVKNGKIIFYTCGASSFTMNPTGGTAGSNDLRIVIGDCAQAQLYYNALSQIYTGNPPATGCSAGSTMDAWPVMRIAGTSYGNDFTAWSTNTTTGATVGNTYYATSTMTRVVGAFTYTLVIEWEHTAPNKFLTWKWRVVIPPGNTNNVRFYYGMDSYVAGADANDVGYYTMTGGETVGIYDNVANIVSAFRYIDGPAWTAYQADGYTAVRTQIANGVDFTDNIQTTGGDLGYGINWNLGTTAGTYTGTVEWRVLPFVTANVPDLIPGIAQPEGPLTTNLLSQMPITVTNAGNASSSGVHTVVMTVPANITGPGTAFTDNGWSCTAQIGTGVTCTKTTNISTPLGTDTVRIPVTPTLAASGTSVTFNVSISNPGDSDITNNTAFATNAVVGGAPPNDPGGVTGENLWLRAANGTNCTTTGCTITTWTNQGGLGAAANAVTGLGTVTYDPTNRINGNPTLYFNAASLNTNNNLGLPTRANSIFVVSSIGTGGRFYMGTQTVTNNTRYWSTSPTTDQWQRYNSTIFYNGTNSRSSNTPAITSTIRQTAGASAGYTNGRSVLTSADTTVFTVNNFGIGRVGNTNSTLSNIAEVIVYPTAITLAQKNQVESYLALKYGITLDQTTATDYTLSNASVVWDASDAGVFNANIAGIARDDTTTLSQLRSQSATNTGDIILSKTAIATNRQAITWGNNNGNVNTFTGADAPFGFQRIAREWYFQERNGDMATVTLSYPATSVPAGFTGIVMLLTDMDGSFASSSSAYTGTYNTGAATWDFSLNIADNQYMTIAKRVPTDTTPPVISTITPFTGSILPTGNSISLSFAYSDTGSSIDTSSVTGSLLKWNTGSSTWIAIPGALTNTSFTATSATYNSTGRAFGKYRFDVSVGDTEGNTQTGSTTFYIDQLEFNLSMPEIDVGDVMTSSTKFSSGEMVITVRTVGAGFTVLLNDPILPTYLTQTIPDWDGTKGYGYEKFSGSYSGAISAIDPWENLATQATSINTSGDQNIYTYRIKIGTLVDSMQSAGIYEGNMSFRIVANY